MNEIVIPHSLYASCFDITNNSIIDNAQAHDSLIELFTSGNFALTSAEVLILYGKTVDKAFTFHRQFMTGLSFYDLARSVDEQGVNPEKIYNTIVFDFSVKRDGEFFQTQFIAFAVDNRIVIVPSDSMRKLLIGVFDWKGAGVSFLRVFCFIQKRMLDEKSLIKKVKKVDGQGLSKNNPNVKHLTNPVRVIDIQYRYVYEPHESERCYTRHTDSWGVRGHYRHYKNGKVVFVSPHTRGKGSVKSTQYNIGGPL